MRGGISATIVIRCAVCINVVREYVLQIIDQLPCERVGLAIMRH